MNTKKNNIISIIIKIAILCTITTVVLVLGNALSTEITSELAVNQMTEPSIIAMTQIEMLQKIKPFAYFGIVLMWVIPFLKEIKIIINKIKGENEDEKQN